MVITQTKQKCCPFYFYKYLTLIMTTGKYLFNLQE